MRVSDMVQVNATYRQYRKAQTLLATLRDREQFYSKRYTLQPRHHERLDQHLQQLQHFIHRLDKIEFISDTPIPACLKNSVSHTCRYIFEGLPDPGKAQHNSFEQHLAQAMTMAGRDDRARSLKFLLASEVAYRHAQGWYMLFNTLTVDRHHYLKVFSKTSNAFRDYIDKVDNAVAAAAYGSVRNAKGKDFHSYFAVVEEGTLNGRLHIHVLHFMRQLPEGCRDPNYGRRAPDHWEISRFKRWWYQGYSSPKTVRVSPLDAWGKAGYRWPLDPKTREPFKTGSAQRVAGYVGKYVMKSYASNKRSDYLWRVRKSQQLGQQLLSMLTRHLPKDALLAMAGDTATRYKLGSRTIPNRLLRIASLRRLQSLLSSKTLFRSATALQPRPSLLQLLRASTETSGNRRSSPNTMFSSLTSCDATVTYDHWRPIIQHRVRSLEQRFFAAGSTGYYASTRDLIY